MRGPSCGRAEPQCSPALSGWCEVAGRSRNPRNPAATRRATVGRSAAGDHRTSFRQSLLAGCRGARRGAPRAVSQGRRARSRIRRPLRATSRTRRFAFRRRTGPGIDLEDLAHALSPSASRFPPWHRHLCARGAMNPQRMCSPGGAPTRADWWSCPNCYRWSTSGRRGSLAYPPLQLAVAAHRHGIQIATCGLTFVATDGADGIRLCAGLPGTTFNSEAPAAQALRS